MWWKMKFWRCLGGGLCFIGFASDFTTNLKKAVQLCSVLPFKITHCWASFLPSFPQLPLKVWRASWMSNYPDQAFNGLHFFVVTFNVFCSFVRHWVAFRFDCVEWNEKLHEQWKNCFLCSDESLFCYFIVEGVNLWSPRLFIWWNERNLSAHFRK